MNPGGEIPTRCAHIGITIAAEEDRLTWFRAEVAISYIPGDATEDGDVEIIETGVTKNENDRSIELMMRYVNIVPENTMERLLEEFRRTFMFIAGFGRMNMTKNDNVHRLVNAAETVNINITFDIP